MHRRMGPGRDASMEVGAAKPQEAFQQGSEGRS
jgi:hypothetical protein